jgi:hypothetical protein
MKKVLIKTLFSILIFFQIQDVHSDDDYNLDSLCTLSNIPLINKTIGCRKVTAEEINSLKEYWSNETNEDLCHYFYFPIADPYATKQLLLDNYLIMEKEIIKRDIDCKKDYRNVFWYRGKDTKSMLKKLLERYLMPYSLDDKKMDKNILLFTNNLYADKTVF